MSELRHALLRRDPLSAAKELLYHLDIALGSSLQGATGLEHSSVELVEEFIFHIPKDRNTPRKRMSCVQELQLLEIICSYFQEQSKEAVRQQIFSALFTLQGNKADDSRLLLLGKLVSMAVAVCRVPILECAATWLQRTRTAWCVRLALVLVDDYCTLVPGSITTLQNVCKTSPRFCCQLITAITALYHLSSDELTPPPSLLDMVVGWISDDPRLLLLSFINTPLSSSLPLGCLEATPLSGLLRWCVKAPLASQRARKSAAANAALEQENGALCEELYSKLHLSVLQVFLMLQVHLSEQNLLGRLAVLQLESVAALVEEVAALVEELNPLHAGAQVQLALDRLAQALQVAMATGALLCPRDDVRTLCSRLPHNNMLQLVMSGPVVPHGAAFQSSVYPYIHPARPTPHSQPHPNIPTLSPLITTHHQLTPHSPLLTPSTPPPWPSRTGASAEPCPIDPSARYTLAHTHTHTARSEPLSDLKSSIRMNR